MPEPHNAHPMLEPVNYDLDPEQASKYFSGNELKIYNLLWNTAVATHVEGPVIRQHQLFSRLSIKTTLCLMWSELLEPGWSSFLTEYSIGNIHFNNSLFSSNMNPVFISPYNEHCLLSKEYLNNLSFSFNPEIELTFSVKKAPEENLCYSTIIEQMAKHKVARPSTYASRLESTIKNGLIGQDKDTLFLTTTGNNLLEKIAQLPADEQLNKQTSYAIENAIDAIERDHQKAGELLNHFCEKIFKKTSKLAVWLDNLEIEGETLDEIYNKASNKKHLFNESIGKTRDKMQEGGSSCLESSLVNILHEKNNSSKIECIEHAWDDFSFQMQLFNTKFTGRLYTRHANRLETPKERIFQEHLNDFQVTIYYGFWMKIPQKHLVKSIDFSILTDRTKGNLYLEELKITYSYEFSRYDEYKIDENEIKKTVSDRFSEIELSDYHLFSLWVEGPEIVVLKERE